MEDLDLHSRKSQRGSELMNSKRSPFTLRLIFCISFSVEGLIRSQPLGWVMGAIYKHQWYGWTSAVCGLTREMRQGCILEGLYKQRPSQIHLKLPVLPDVSVENSLMTWLNSSLIIEFNCGSVTEFLVWGSFNRVWGNPDWSGAIPIQVSLWDFCLLTLGIGRVLWGWGKVHFKSYRASLTPETDHAQQKLPFSVWRWSCSSPSLGKQGRRKPQTRILRTQSLHLKQLTNEHLKRCYKVCETVVHELFNSHKFPLNWESCFLLTDGDTTAQR